GVFGESVCELVADSLGAGTSGNQEISFVHLAHLPSRDQVCDGAAFVHANSSGFADESSIASDQEFSPVHHPLIFAGINEDEIPFRIAHEDLASEIRW